MSVMEIPIRGNMNVTAIIQGPAKSGPTETGWTTLNKGLVATPRG